MTRRAPDKARGKKKIPVSIRKRPGQRLNLPGQPNLSREQEKPSRDAQIAAGDRPKSPGTDAKHPGRVKYSPSVWIRKSTPTQKNKTGSLYKATGPD